MAPADEAPLDISTKCVLGLAIPAYRAGEWVGFVVERAKALAESLPCRIHLLVIDDGSDDDTAERARQAGADVESHSTNRGKGVALRTAFGILMERGCSAVVTLDADGQHLPEEVPRLLEARDGADLVLGTRSHLFEGMSPLRCWSNRLSSGAISIAAGRKFSDVQTGFRLYSRNLIENVPFRGSRFEAESAIVVRAARRGLRIVSVPVKLGFPDGRRTSHYRPVIDSLRIARAVTRARLEWAG